MSLDRLRAYSIKKGCYPGQEIVARTHFLGQAKRGLALFETDADVPAGSDVVDGERTLGTIVSTAADAATQVVLAVLPLDHGSISLSANGQPLRELPLTDGLAR